jgi:hypothetical protein
LITKKPPTSQKRFHMHESKLIATLKLLKKEEIEGIVRLLASELLIKGSNKRDCETLFNYLLLFYPNFDDDALLKEKTFQKIFKDSDSKINRLEKTMSALLQIVEYYIVHFVIEQNYETLRYNLILSQYYREKDLPQRSESFLLKAEAELKVKNKALEPEYYYWQNEVNEEKISIRQVKGEKISSDLYAILLNSSIEYSILYSIKSLVSVVFKQLIFDDNMEQLLTDLDKIIKKNEDLNSNVIIKLYLLGLWMQRKFKDNDFYTLLQEYEQLFDKNYKKIEISTAYTFSTIKRICVTLRHNYQFDNESLLLVLNSYKKDLETGFVFINDLMYSATADNIVRYALKLKQNDWVKYFLETYSDKIGFKHENREEIVRFCWAQYYFAEKQYAKAEENTNVYYENIFYFITCRRVQIKIYFERKEYQVLESELEAFKIYLYRQYKQKKEISEDFFIVNNNFVDALKQIYHLQFSFNATKKKNLIEKLESGKYSEQDWLSEKVKLLKG